MGKMLTQEIASTEKGKRLLQQERAILEVTELICAIMDESGVSKTELAARLGKSKGYISQILDGTANMTIRTIADVFTALDTAVHFHDGEDNPRSSAASEITRKHPLPRKLLARR